MSKGKLIVLEGLDGSGKATQAKLLAESFLYSQRADAKFPCKRPHRRKCLSLF